MYFFFPKWGYSPASASIDAHSHLLQSMYFLTNWQLISYLLSNDYQLPQSAVHKILSAAPPAESNSFRVDFRGSHVHYLNNLEEDALYKRWRSNLNEVCSPLCLPALVNGDFIWMLLSCGKSNDNFNLLFFCGFRGIRELSVCSLIVDNKIS